jgi:hypothetical protein
MAIPKLLDRAIEKIVHEMLHDATARFLLVSPPRDPIQSYLLYDVGILVLARQDRFAFEAFCKTLMAEARLADSRWTGLQAADAAKKMIQALEKIR